MAKAKTKVGWYVYAKLPAIVNPKLVSGCFETRAGAEVYARLYKANTPDSEVYIERNASSA